MPTATAQSVAAYTSPLRSGVSLQSLRNLITTQFGATAAIGGQKHYGIDLRAPEGTPIYAPANGKVSRIYSEAAGGNVLIVDTGNGITQVFAHLSKYAVSPNQTFKQGQIIGYVGKTGKVTGAHLHWETKVNGKPFNPLNLFDGTGQFTPPTVDSGSGFSGGSSGSDIPVISEALDVASAVTGAAAFIFNPANWAALLALLAGIALVFVGGKMVWSAV